MLVWWLMVTDLQPLLDHVHRHIEQPADTRHMHQHTRWREQPTVVTRMVLAWGLRAWGGVVGSDLTASAAMTSNSRTHAYGYAYTV